MYSYNQPVNLKIFPREKYLGIGNDAGYCDQEIGFKRHNCDNNYSGYNGKSLKVEKPVLTVDINGKVFSLPGQLFDIVSCVEISKNLLALEEDWHYEGADQISITTWENAVIFLINYSKSILVNYGVIIKAPEINPCRNGSIDLAWRTKSARLLINIKPSGGAFFGTYYGDKYNNREAIKNPIESYNVIDSLAFWMKNLS